MLPKCDVVSRHFHYSQFCICQQMTALEAPNQEACQFWGHLNGNSDTFGIWACTTKTFFLSHKNVCKQFRNLTF